MDASIDLWTGRTISVLGAYTVTQRDRFVYFGLGFVTGDITLPAASLVRGIPFIFYYLGGILGGVATLKCVGSDTIIKSDGVGTSIAMQTDHDYLIMYSDGVYWHTLKAEV